MKKKKKDGKWPWRWSHLRINIHPVFAFLQQRSIWEQLCKQPRSGWVSVFPQQSQAPGRDPAVRYNQESQFLLLFMCLPGTDSLESGPPRGWNSVLLKPHKQPDRRHTNAPNRANAHTSHPPNDHVFTPLASCSSPPCVNMIFQAVTRYMCNLLFRFACLTLYHEHFLLLHNLPASDLYRLHDNPSNWHNIIYVTTHSSAVARFSLLLITPQWSFSFLLTFIDFSFFRILSLKSKID